MSLFVGMPYVLKCSWKPEKTLVPLDLELQAVVRHQIWALGIELRSSIRVVLNLTPEPSLQPSLKVQVNI